MYSLKIDNDRADLYLYSAILGSEYGFAAQDIIEKLNTFEGSQIVLHINSEGGDIFEAQGMHSYLRNHKANIQVYIEGLCASAAGIIALAGDKVFMPENALYMIHNPQGLVWGESEEMRKQAEILDKVRDSIAILYERKTGLTHAKVLELMRNETWLTAKEAKKLNLVDEILPALNVQNITRDYKAGVEDERARLKALDSLSTPECEVIINEAKYVNFKSANEIALDLLQAERRAKDAVRLNPSARAQSEDIIDIKSVSEIINRMRGYK